MAMLNEFPTSKSHTAEGMENNSKLDSEVCAITSVEFSALSCLLGES